MNIKINLGFCYPSYLEVQNFQSLFILLLLCLFTLSILREAFMKQSSSIFTEDDDGCD